METLFGRIVRADPSQASRLIVYELDRHEGSLADAAVVIGCDVRTLYRWIGRLSIWPRVDAVLNKYGKIDPQKGGRPRGAVI